MPYYQGFARNREFEQNGANSTMQADEQTTPRKRTFRKFTYRGIDLDQLLDLSSEQFMELVHCRARRRFQRGLKRKPMGLIKKLRAAKKNAPAGEKPEVVKTHLRNMIIVPEMIGSIVGVYNGKVFNQVEIKPEMTGHYLAEFSISYKPVKHGRPGIGATSSSKFVPLKKKSRQPKFSFDIFVSLSSYPQIYTMADQTFATFDFDPRLARAVAQLNFTRPTPIQAQGIPLALAGKDILARARTGSGKTAAYAMPIVQKILAAKESLVVEPSIKALILVPTRELAEQVTSHINKLLVYANQLIKVVNLAGQTSAQLQRPLLAEKPDIVVATPSKALSHLEANNMDLKKSLENLVIDEADLVLSFGYEDDVRKILSYLPKIYQSFLMSATFTKEIEELTALVLRKPAILALEDTKEENDSLTQYVVKCTEFEKFMFAFVIIKLRLIKGKILLFVNDIDRSYKLKLFLEQFSIKSCVLNSELPLNSRYHIVEEFNRGIYDYLIATDESELKGEQDSDDEDEDIQEDIEKQEGKDEEKDAKKAQKGKKVQRDKEYGVSRGVDFQGVAAVINFDFPTSAKAYTHRIGRTARGGQRGMSLSFIVTKDLVEDKKEVARGKDIYDDSVYLRVKKQQEAKGAELKPYSFEKKNVSGFKYRVEDALKAVNKVAVKEARIKEIKREIMNSEKLKAHFEDKPKDLEFLRHDHALQPAKVQDHLKHIPSYLMPRIAVPTAMANSEPIDAPFKSQKRKRGNFKKGTNKKRKDPLKIIKRR
ncbi:hypothetical protein [Parasitella parasitica]|uniref:RNA helicase n=1 Tax=Parasitella parasitica TaxID=35722 RepID=A0A0B7NCH7_9FUNG|nr:hypothetical protein [Parasitella parasitica]